MGLLERLKEYHFEQYTHVKRTAHLCVLIGVELGFNNKQLQELKKIGLYHDIGKLRIPIEILSKTDELTEQEYNVIKQHSLYSISFLKTDNMKIREAILYHHENLDGSGYYKIKDNNLSIYQRIIRVADVYDALTSERCYKTAWTKEEAFKYLKDNSGTMFDKDIVRILEDIIF